MTKTRSRTKALTIAAIAIGVGGLAFAFLPRFGAIGYSESYVECHDGSYKRGTQENTEVAMKPFGQFGGKYLFSNPFGCQTQDFYKGVAEQFCAERTSRTTGKEGVNTFKVSSRCLIRRGHDYGFDYGYGYGYNAMNQGLTSKKPSKSTKTKSYNKSSSKTETYTNKK